MPAIPKHIKSLEQQDSIIKIMGDISISDLIRLGEAVGITLSPEAREKKATPRTGLRRSTRLNPDLRAEISSLLSSLGTCPPTPSDIIDIDNLTLMGIADIPLIPEARILSVKGKTVSSSRGTIDQAPLSAGAWQITREARGRLNLQTIPDRATQYLPTSNTWASYVPQGMVAESQWEDIIREVTRSLKRDEVKQGPTRAQRAEARDKRRD
ncbi:hypothetical protein BKA56DRAFT_613951 [Ilyonectria sp. MPI-CAGE-AT-0026]|nr:hypothetical protein BKA56DRAFT_613951 [Ilyonectria sp. MPI-CAGE-AT-0026]